MTASQRIKHIIKSKQLTIEAFAQKTGITRGTLYQMFKNDSNPKLPLLAACVKEFPDLNARWLLTGDGEVWDKTEQSSIISKDYNSLKNQMEEMETIMSKVVLKMEKQVEESLSEIKGRIQKLEAEK